VTNDGKPREHKRADEAIMTDIIMPNQTNGFGTIFGGEAMALMDRAAAVASLRFARQPVVTAATERISFRSPIHQNEIVELRAKVIHSGTTSLIVRVHVYAEHPLTGERRLCTTGYFSMVAVDMQGRPQPVPELLIESDEERGEWQHGEEVRRAILERGE
jgi:acyl-CoA hydrolase